MYYDINSDTSSQSSFTLGENFIDTNVSAVYYTLNQLSQNTAYEIIAWNDGTLFYLKKQIFKSYFFYFLLNRR